MNTLFLGTDDNNDQANLFLSEDARMLGSYVIGTTGTGKTSFLKSLIMRDIEAGHGVCVLDPHGDLIDDILACYPKQRPLSHVLLFNPADMEYPFGLNLFTCDQSDPRERDRVTSTVMDTLYKLFFYSWGPRMEDLLRHSIQTLLYYPDSTFLELRLLLTDPVKRQHLKQPACDADPILKHFWEQQFTESYQDKDGNWHNPKAQTDLIGSTLNKIGRFLVNPLIRNIIAQAHNTIDFRMAMDSGQVILVNLSKGDLGPDNSSFLGSVLVNQLLLAALARRDTPPDQRRKFYLYVDEYQNFATQTFPELQAEARKYRIVTTVAHQYRDQLDESNKGSTLNVANLFVFRVSGYDALNLAAQFDNTPPDAPPRFDNIYGEVAPGVYGTYELPSGFTPKQQLPGLSQPYSDVQMEMANLLTNLPQHQAIIRIMDTTTTPKALRQYRLNSQEYPGKTDLRTVQAIRNASQKKGTPRAIVEESIARRMQGSVDVAPSRWLEDAD